MKSNYLVSKLSSYIVQFGHNLLIVFLLSSLQLVTESSAQQPLAVDSMAIEDRVLLLQDKEKGACASAFYLTPQLILTSLHFAKGVCSEESCEKLMASRSTTIGARALIKASSDLYLVKQSALLDMAILSNSKLSPDWAELFRLIPDSHDWQDDKVLLFGFPHCKSLTQRTAAVSTTNSLHLYLESDQAAPGSSGSLVTTTDGTPLALIQQAEAGTGKNLLVHLGAAPKGLRALKLSATSLYQNFEDKEQDIAALLLEVYEQRVNNIDTLTKRLLRSFEWQDLLIRFDNDRREFGSGQILIPSYVPTASYLVKSSQENHSALHTLQQRSLDERYGNSEFAGTYRYGALVLFSALIIFIFLVLLYAFSVSAVFYTSSKKGFALALEVFIAAIFLWPVGLLVILLRRYLKES